MKNKMVIKIVPETNDLDQTIGKVEKLNRLLNEAMEIANSIASLNLDLRINAVINDKSTELARISTE